LSTGPNRPAPKRTPGTGAGPAGTPAGGRSSQGPGTGFGADAARGMNQASRGLAVAIGFVLVVLLFFGAGRLLDNWVGTEPWGTVIGSIVGWVLGVVVVYYMAQRSLD
jgi:hypothetical protein